MANGGRLLPGQAYAFVACAGLILVIAQAVGHSWADLGVGRWFSGDIPLHMRLNLRGNAAWNPAAVEALRDWNGAGSRFGFSWTQGAGTLRCRADGEHSVVWADELCRGVAWGDRTLAITSTWYEPSIQRIVDADVIFNTGWSWGVYSGPLRPDVIDFGRVALHEFGHVVGLDHPDDRGQIRTAIMNGSVSGIDRLQPDDIDGIRALYGSDAPAGAPDLVVRSLLASPSTVTPGDVFSLSATVRNVGNGTAAATRLNWRYWRSSTRQWLQLGFDSVPRLAPAGLSPESLRVRAPRTPGRYYFNACVVAVAGEQNRGNCADFITVTVAGRGGGAPDLTVGSLRTVPGTLRAGRNFTLHATVRNVGTGTAGATTLSYYYWHSDTRDWERVGTGPVAGLAASGSSVESVVLRAPTTTGTHYYTACVRAVAGEPEGSNCARRLQVTVTSDGDAGPDLVVESFRASPASPAVGSSFRLHATVRNAGTGTAEAATLRYYYYRTSTEEWVVLGHDDVVGLGPSESSPESLGVRAPSRAGTTSFSACVSRVGGETARDNNCAETLRVTFR